MKILKTYNDFLNEELRVLKGPSDDETFEIPPLERIKLVKFNRIDKKFYPSNEELDKATDKMEYIDILNLGIDYDIVYLVKKAIEEGGVDIEIKDKQGYTPFLKSFYYETTNVLKYLVKKGANVNALVKLHKSPLMSASENNEFEIVKLLVENGVDVNYLDSDHRTALFSASEKLNFEIVKYLLNNGAKINIVDIYNVNALVFAINNNRKANRSNKFETVKILIDRGIDVNNRDVDGKTPIFYALTSYFSDKDISIIKYIVSHGADLTIKDNDGNSVLSKAYKLDKNLLKYLKN